MKNWKPIASAVLAASFAGCAARPAYFGDAARLVRENGTAYWEAPALAPAYLSVRMRRRRRAPAREAAIYDGALTLRSPAPAVLRSTFILAEGSSATFHYEFNVQGAALRYEPASLDVVVACALGACRAESRPVPIAPDGSVAVKARKPRREKRAAVRKTADAAAFAAGESLRRDAECASLHDDLQAAQSRAERSGDEKDRGAERRLRGRFLLEDCAAWLDRNGGLGAARRRVRLSQWTSLGGN